jgi:hypothetical protein
VELLPAKHPVMTEGGDEFQTREQEQAPSLGRGSPRKQTSSPADEQPLEGAKKQEVSRVIEQGANRGATCILSTGAADHCQAALHRPFIENIDIRWHFVVL